MKKFFKKLARRIRRLVPVNKKKDLGDGMNIPLLTSEDNDYGEENEVHDGQLVVNQVAQIPYLTSGGGTAAHNAEQEDGPDEVSLADSQVEPIPHLPSGGGSGAHSVEPIPHLPSGGESAAHTMEQEDGPDEVSLADSQVDGGRVEIIPHLPSGGGSGVHSVQPIPHLPSGGESAAHTVEQEDGLDEEDSLAESRVEPVHSQTLYSGIEPGCIVDAPEEDQEGSNEVSLADSQVEPMHRGTSYKRAGGSLDFPEEDKEGLDEVSLKKIQVEHCQPSSTGAEPVGSVDAPVEDQEDQLDAVCLADNEPSYTGAESGGSIEAPAEQQEGPDQVSLAENQVEHVHSSPSCTGADSGSSVYLSIEEQEDEQDQVSGSSVYLSAEVFLADNEVEPGSAGCVFFSAEAGEDGLHEVRLVESQAQAISDASAEQQAEQPPVAVSKYHISNLQLVRHIADGGFGKVSLMRLKDGSGTRVADKVTFLKKKKRSYILQNIENEIRVMMKVKGHPNYLEFLYGFHDEVKNEHHLVMEYFPGFILSCLRPNELTNPNMKKILHQICEGLQFLHGKAIIHQDIKPENVLTNNRFDIKIIDFNVATDGPYADGYCGTPGFIAPEVALHEIQHNAPPYTYTCDYYSVGCIIYCLYYGKPIGMPDRPIFFRDYTASEKRELMLKTSITGNIYYPKNLEEPLMSLMKGLLEHEPKSRLNDTNILEHPFFN